jgi:hypothetical protein
MANNRAFILLTYILYGHLNKVSGQKKSNCLNVILALLKYAWKKNNYKCAVRYSTLAKDTGLAKITVRRTVLTLAKLNVITIKRLRSANQYTINPTFIKSERSNLDTLGVLNGQSGGSYLDSINRSINNRSINTLSEVDKIINKGLSRDDTLKLLANLPLQDLTNDTNNPYYVKLALALKEDNEKPKMELNAGQVLREMSKKTNMNYKMKVEYNKRNNIKPWLKEK